MPAKSGMLVGGTYGAVVLRLEEDLSWSGPAADWAKENVPRSSVEEMLETARQRLEAYPLAEGAPPRNLKIYLSE